jgi:hypothetical protein
VCVCHCSRPPSASQPWHDYEGSFFTSLSDRNERINSKFDERLSQVFIMTACTPPATESVTPTVSRKVSSPLLSIRLNVCRSLTIVYPASVKASCSVNGQQCHSFPINSIRTSETYPWSSAKRRILPARLQVLPPLRTKLISVWAPKANISMHGIHVNDYD